MSAKTEVVDIANSIINECHIVMDAIDAGEAITKELIGGIMEDAKRLTNCEAVEGWQEDEAEEAGE